jgi:hypothetical protein
MPIVINREDGKISVMRLNPGQDVSQAIENWEQTFCKAVSYIEMTESEITEYFDNLVLEGVK